MLRRSFWPRHPSHKLHLFFQQWGTFQDIAQGSVINFPITFNNNVFAIAGNDQSENGDNAQVLTFREKKHNLF